MTEISENDMLTGEPIYLDEESADVYTSEVHAQLVVDREYPTIDDIVKLECKHNVPLTDLHKVSFGRDDIPKKFFEYFNGRTPPFVNTTIPGAIMEEKKFNAGQVSLRITGFEATGKYYCEVATSAPYIYSRDSPDKEIIVVSKQKDPPTIGVSIRTNGEYENSNGDELFANCSTSIARPPPHVTWMINGIRVDEKHIRIQHFPPPLPPPPPPAMNPNRNSHRSKSHQKNNLSHDKMESSGIIYSKSSMVVDKGSESSLPNTKQQQHIGYERHQNHNCDHEDLNFDKPQQLQLQQHQHQQHNEDDNFEMIAENIRINKHIRKHRNCKNRHFNNQEDRIYGDLRTVSGGGGGGHGGSSSISTIKSISSIGGGGGGLGAGLGLGVGVGSGHVRDNIRHHEKLIDFASTYSELRMFINELNLETKGKIEITCTSTIPDKPVGIDHVYPDFKSSSIKIDLNPPPEITSLLPPAMSGPAALGNNSSASILLLSSLQTLIICLFIIVMSTINNIVL